MKKTFQGSLEFDSILYENVKITITGTSLEDCQYKLESMSFDELKNKIKLSGERNA